MSQKTIPQWKKELNLTPMLEYKYGFEGACLLRDTFLARRYSTEQGAEKAADGVYDIPVVQIYQAAMSLRFTHKVVQHRRNGQHPWVLIMWLENETREEGE